MAHLRCWIADNTPHKPDEALRSEITAALFFIKQRMQVIKDAHQSIPVSPPPSPPQSVYTNTNTGVCVCR